MRPFSFIIALSIVASQVACSCGVHEQALLHAKEAVSKFPTPANKQLLTVASEKYIKCIDAISPLVGRLQRTGSSGSMGRAGSSGSKGRAGSSGSMSRPGSSGSKGRAGSSGSMSRASSSGSKGRRRSR
jgi:hypothetical protein